LFCSKIQDVISAFKYPLRRFVNFNTDDDCMLSYPRIWRMLKSLNINGLNHVNKSKYEHKHDKVEKMLFKAAKMI